MIAFVTTLRHPDNAASYERVERLLQATLASVTQQDSEDYVVIVVGNRLPNFDLPARVHFVPVDFAAPAPPSGPMIDRGAFVRDKGTKVGAGLIAARRFDPQFVMIFDADDFVSRRIAGFVSERPTAPGWVIDRGWMYSSLRGVFRPIERFNKTCGTSFIIPFAAYGVPSHLSVDAPQSIIADSFGDRLASIMGAHRDAVEWHATRGRILERLPFRGAVYHVDTGENHSGKSLKGLAVLATTKLLTEFGITSHRNARHRILAAVGPQYAAESLRSFVAGLRARAGRRFR